MLTFDFKAGSGSASRRVAIGNETYTLGAFVQSNFGRRYEMTVQGKKVGLAMPGGELRGKPVGSIIAVIATDAPLLPHQLKRLARRVPVGIARTGGIGHNGSGDILSPFRQPIARLMPVTLRWLRCDLYPTARWMICLKRPRKPPKKLFLIQSSRMKPWWEPTAIQLSGSTIIVFCLY